MSSEKSMMPMEKMDSAKILGTFTFKPLDDVAWYGGKSLSKHTRIFFSFRKRSHSLQDLHMCDRVTFLSFVSRDLFVFCTRDSCEREGERERERSCVVSKDSE